jgi:hypothetical protein
MTEATTLTFKANCSSGIIRLEGPIFYFCQRDVRVTPKSKINRIFSCERLRLACEHVPPLFEFEKSLQTTRLKSRKTEKTPK